MFDVATSDIAKQKINGERDQLGLMHWKADLPPKMLFLVISRMKALTCTAFSF